MSLTAKQARIEQLTQSMRICWDTLKKVVHLSYTLFGSVESDRLMHTGSYRAGTQHYTQHHNEAVCLRVCVTFASNLHYECGGASNPT